MSRLKFLGADPTCDQINDYFKIGTKVNISTIPQSKLEGNMLDPSTGGPAVIHYRQVLPAYKRNKGYGNDIEQTAYVDPYIRQDEEEFLARQVSQMGNVRFGGQSIDDGTSSMTSGLENVHDTISTVATVVDHSHGVTLPEGMTEEAAVRIYEDYNTRHQYDPNLPITKCREEIVDLIESQPVTVIHGETGSGKTTQVAQYIMDHYAANNRYCNIVVTQPRRIAAVSIARRVCAERGWQCGRICGYQIGMDRVASEDTRLLYCTTGVLLQKLIAAKNMHQFTHVILDEVHERDQESDFCLMVVRKLLRLNSQYVKVVLMSATIESDKFASYFSRPVNGKFEKAPVYNVLGHVYDVTEFYLEDLAKLGKLPSLDPDKPEATVEAMDLAVELIKSFDSIENPTNQSTSGLRGSVLIFLPGLYEISEMDSKLRPLVHSHKLQIRPLHSTITSEEQVLVFDRPTAEMRKVILSTNIAESSITVPDIRYVIDFCLTKTMVCDPETNYSSLQMQWASKANCKQRKGRAGRVAQGRCYRLVKNKFWFEHLPAYGVPEMQRSPLEQLILKVKMLDLGEPKAILGLALSPPRLDDIERTIILLKEVGALASLASGEVNPHDGDLTFLGRVLGKLPVDIRLGKLMMLGYVFGVLEETIIISASQSLKSFFAKPFKSELESYKHKLAWATDTFSDSLCYLNAYRTWQRQVELKAFRSQRDELQWGRDGYIQIRDIKKVQELVIDLTRRLKDMNVFTPTRPFLRPANKDAARDEIILKLVLCGAFYPNYFEEVPGDEKLADREMSGYNPFTTIMVKGLPANQGALYRHDVEEFFSHCDDRKPKIHFEETRAFVEFTRDPTDGASTKVLRAVYVALKLRQLREALEINLYDVQTANSQMSQFLRQDETRLRSNRIDDCQTGGIVYGPQQVAIPNLSNSVFPIQVGNVIHCGRFWAYRPDQMNIMQIRHIQSYIRNQNLSARQSCTFNIGDYCLAPYTTDGHREYFRARIQQIQRNIATVFFVDYGNISDANVQELYEIHPALLELQFQAFECELCKIKPSAIKCPNGQWTPEATRRFARYIEDADILHAKIYSVVHDIVRIDLFADIGDHQIFINQELIHQNYADEAEESYLSVQNHQIREETVMTGPVNSVQYRGPLMHIHDAVRQSGDRSLSDVSRRSGNKLILKGPWNTYEVNFGGCTFSGKRRTTRIERDSVNSVAINDELRAGANEVKNCARMLIASIVTLSPRSDALQARDTTLMPSIPGLLALVALTFSPSAELRTDKDKTRYTGALCGLGWDIDSPDGDSAFPDHDMEIVFDFHFDVADLKGINSVRMAINLSLTGEYGPDCMERFQKRAREQLLLLIEKRRDPITPIPFRNQYRWRQVDPDDVIPHTIDDMSQGSVLYNLHSGIALSQPAEDEKSKPSIEMLNVQKQKQAHNNWLISKASKSTEPENIECRLCGRMMHTPYELLVHLRSLMHLQNL